jgi:hypothetical protein
VEGLCSRKFCLALCLVLVGTIRASAYYSYTNLADAYAALAFDPSAPGNSVVVVFSDPHIDLDSHGGTTPFTYDLDSRLVDSVNAMTPPPAKILVAGDVTSSYSEVPGYIPQGDWNITMGTNEMVLWLSAIQAFTNVSISDIVYIPGNHDQDPRETNAERFSTITGMPPHQVLDICGVRFLMMNGGNYGHPSADEREWLLAQVASTSPTQTVAVVVHQPPFGAISSERGIALLLREALGNWPNFWWVYAGHAHGQILGVYGVGNSKAVVKVTSTTNARPYYGGRSLGYRIICLSNPYGIVGNLYYHFDKPDIQVEPYPDWRYSVQYSAAFENTTGLLWRRLKSAGTPPEMLVTNANDAIDWYSYPTELQWALPLDRYGNQATHFLLLSTGFGFASAISFSADRTNWVPCLPLPETNQVFAFALPPSVAASATGYVRYMGIARPDIAIGGWGLATTNNTTFPVYPQLTPIPDQTVIVGQTLLVTNSYSDPYAPPDQVTYSIVSGPADASVDPVTGLFSWTPKPDSAGLVPVTIKVADNGTPQMSSTQEFWIRVGTAPEPMAMMLNGNFNLRIYGGTNATYTIEASTNFLDWLPIYQTNAMITPFDFSDPDFTNFSQRFYRVSSQSAFGGQ